MMFPTCEALCLARLRLATVVGALRWRRSGLGLRFDAVDTTGVRERRPAFGLVSASRFSVEQLAAKTHDYEARARSMRGAEGVSVWCMPDTCSA